MMQRSFWARPLFVLLVSSALANARSEDLPKIGLVDFYGLRTVKQADLVRALEIKRGDPMPIDFGGRDPSEVRKALALPETAPLPANQVDIQHRVEQVKGVGKARV